jgi:pimeloyl-ACP methyl ester carboxylesterase
VLVVAGAEDALVSREESEDIARHLQRCQFVVIPRAGHLSSLENPEDFSEVLGTFLQANL